MNDARLGAFAAPHVAGYQPYTARAAVAGAAVIGQVDAVSQSSVQQQLAAACRKAASIDGNLVTSRHCLIPEGSPVYGWSGRPAAAALPGMLSKSGVPDLNRIPSSFGSRNVD
jgi:hypothetical protein